MKFNVGDIIKGIPKNGYGVTNENCLCEVIEVLSESKNRIRVRVIGTMSFEDGWSTLYTDDTYTVKAHLFEPVITKPQPEKKETTIAEIEKELGYSIKIIKKEEF